MDDNDGVAEGAALTVACEEADGMTGNLKD